MSENQTVMRVDKVCGPLIEGTTYLVPTLKGPLGGLKHLVREYPVLIGPRHYDVEYFNVHMPHYHIDLRFVDMRVWRNQWDGNIPVGAGRLDDGSLPKPEYKPWRCLQNHVILNFDNSPDFLGYKRMCRHFAGAQCGGSRERGWICPHKGTNLASTPSHNGVITCPAHALKIDEATGKVLLQ